MHGKRNTLRSAKWGGTKQRQHGKCEASPLHDSGRKTLSARRHGQNARRHGGPALDETLCVVLRSAQQAPPQRLFLSLFL